MQVMPLFPWLLFGQLVDWFGWLLMNRIVAMWKQIVEIKRDSTLPWDGTDRDYNYTEVCIYIASSFLLAVVVFLVC